MRNYVQKTKYPKDGIFNVGVAKLVIPSDKDRNLYVQECLRSNYITCVTQDGIQLNRMYVDSRLFNSIYFPSNNGDRSTYIIYIKPAYGSRTIAIGALLETDGISPFNEEGDLFFGKTETNGKAATISGNSLKGEMFINVSGDLDGEGNYKISVKNKNRTAKYEAFVSGSYKVTATNRIDMNASNVFRILLKNNSDANDNDTFTITIDKNKGMLLQDTFNNLEIATEEGKLKVYKEKNEIERALKGETTSKNIANAYRAITRITVNTPLGPSSTPINLQEFNNLANEIEGETVFSKSVEHD